MEQQEKHVTDPQQDEINGNVLQKPFEELFGSTKEGQKSEEEIKEDRPLREAEKGAKQKKG
jgi:hypothetical protein